MDKAVAVALTVQLGELASKNTASEEVGTEAPPPPPVSVDQLSVPDQSLSTQPSIKNLSSASALPIMADRASPIIIIILIMCLVIDFLDPNQISTLK